MQNRSSHIGKLAQFLISDTIDDLCFGNDARITNHKSRNIRPVFVKIGVHSARNDRTRDIASAAAERFDLSIGIFSVKAGDHRVFHI